LIPVGQAGALVPVRVELPYHLRLLAQLSTRDVELEVPAPVTLTGVLDALEARYPMLRGTVRDHGSLKRRPFLRFYACEQDFSNLPLDAPLPPEVAAGMEPLLIIGGLAGG
jgi:sulfur-carrier protein